MPTPHQPKNKKNAIFYLVWAAHCIKLKKPSRALKILKTGILSEAVPQDDLFDKFRQLSKELSAKKTAAFQLVNAYDPIYDEISFEEKRAECQKYRFFYKNEQNLNKQVEFLSKNRQNSAKIDKFLNKNGNNKAKNDLNFEKSSLNVSISGAKHKNPCSTPKKSDLITEAEMYAELELSDAFTCDENDDFKNKNDKIDSKDDKFEKNNYKFDKFGPKNDKLEAELLETLQSEENNTLSAPTKTLSFNFYAGDSLMKTPVPKKLFASKRFCSEGVDETETFVFQKDEFFKSVRRLPDGGAGRFLFFDCLIVCIKIWIKII